MNINRHNYEEFFLLYVDNELSATERKAIDSFVQQNPDLQGELLLLQQTVLKADDIVLDKKDWLFMEEGITALQENLLLYADNELTSSEKSAVEALLATDKPALAEWNILQQTKLQPDTSIVFAEKQSLYRTEGGRVVGFKWWRAAAAAVLLGLGLWTVVAVYNNNFKTAGAGEEVIAKENKTNPGQIKNEAPVNTIAGETKSTNTDASHNSNTTAVMVPINPKEHATEKTDQPGEKLIKKNTTAQKDNLAVQNKNQKPSNNLPESYLDNINRNRRNEIVRNNVLPEKNNNISASGINDVIVKTNPKEKITDPAIIDKDLTDPKTTAAIPVIYTEDESNNNRFLYMDVEKVKRTKLGGFIRKAKRMVERTTNIKTGDGLKVAGFEIALK